MLDEKFAELLAGSHARVVGRPLMEEAVPAGTLSEWLYEHAPFVLLAHDTSDDPCFVYANLAAQRRFGYSWDEFVGMPSRLSAEAPEREERERFMSSVREKGFVDDYRGVRITKSGERFWIQDATVWNLLDADGVVRGQAARVPRWTGVA
jgi:PAS domain S-box-containing protein